MNIGLGNASKDIVDNPAVEFGRHGGHVLKVRKKRGRTVRSQWVVVAVAIGLGAGLLAYAASVVQQNLGDWAIRSTVPNPGHTSFNVNITTTNLDKFDAPVLYGDGQSLERIEQQIKEAARLDMNGNIQRSANHLRMQTQTQLAAYQAQRNELLKGRPQSEIKLQELQRDLQQDLAALNDSAVAMAARVKKHINDREAEIIKFVRERREARKK